MTAAAPPPAAVLEALEKENFRVTHVYGLTESTAGDDLLLARGLGRAASHQRAQLKARQGVRYAAEDGVTVMDPATMKEVPRDGATMGEVMFRGNLTMRLPEKTRTRPRRRSSTAGSIPATWACCTRTAISSCAIAPRTSSSRAREHLDHRVEGVIIDHPAVANAAVVASPTRNGRDALRLRDAETRCCGHGRGDRGPLPRQPRLLQCPRYVVFRDLPMTSTGKVQKFVLREWAKAV